jgi:hypothetical protein
MRKQAQESSVAKDAAFADLYHLHRSAVWLDCRRRSGADRADDIMGEVFLTWETVTDWIRANHPNDAGSMISGDGSGPILDARSIDLWGLYTQEFVESQPL